MGKLGSLLRENQQFLMKRILSYAKLHGYVKYTSTLEEAWAASIIGLSEALILAYETMNQIPEMGVEHDFANNPISQFGVLEAKRHRQRGITLEMFLGLMKYYRQSYLDLMIKKIDDPKQLREYQLWVNCFFDQNEISFCKEWAEQTCGSVLAELQNANRELTNNKNKYVTIFESLPLPVLLLDVDNRCSNMNFSAQRLLLQEVFSSGYQYYTAHMPTVDELLPWLRDDFYAFYHNGERDGELEKPFESPNEGKKILSIRFQRMLDVSGKFTGTVIMFADLTERMIMEQQLRHMSYHDTLTGLYNRAYMDKELARMDTGLFDPVGVISCDVDCLKLVNDTLGHLAGDILMEVAGHLIKKCFRENDIACRVGGDEFIVIMPNADEAAVNSACRRLQDAMAEHNAQHKNMPASLSVGWATGSVSKNSGMNEILKKADDRMYAEKKENRMKYNKLFLQRFETFGQSLFQYPELI